VIDERSYTGDNAYRAASSGLVPPSPFAVQSATGAQAVQQAKKVANLRDAITVANEEKSNAATWKAVGDKGFSFKNSFWTENGLSASDLKSAKEVTFLSDEYFALIKSNPEIAKYLSVGPQVIVKCKGVTYKILAPTQS
jgi:hypothetical protein